MLACLVRFCSKPLQRQTSVCAVHPLHPSVCPHRPRLSHPPALQTAGLPDEVVNEQSGSVYPWLQVRGI